jgi:endonuclease YncB( thermonuclease family)
VLIVSLFFLCQVAAVHDGDTLRCRGGPAVRLHAIDAPEMPGACRRGRRCVAGDPYRSRASLRGLALGKTLRCRRTGKSYQRVTAFCAAGGVDLSCAQLRAGQAVRVARFDRDRRLCRRG